MTATPPSGKNRFRLWQVLNPAWLAGAISLGFHGILFAAGPSFPSLGFGQLTEVEEAVERRNVPLVELSAAEQERLPDFSGSFYDFEAFGDLEPLAPLFGDNNNPSGNNDGPINSKPLLSPGSSSLPPSASRLPFGITNLEPRARVPFPLSGLPEPPPIADTETPEVTPAPSDESQASASDTPGADALRPEAEESGDGDQTIAANSNPVDTLTLEERLQAYAFDGANTEAEEIDVRFDEWLASGQFLATELEITDDEAIAAAFEQAAETGLLPSAAATEAAEPDAEAAEPAEPSSTGIVQPPIELSIDHEGGICLTKDPQKGLIGAWVSPEGALVGEPAVIRSTGYLGLNEQAIRYVKTLDFSAVETFTGYQFEVVVNYNPENCVNMGQATPAAPAADSEDSSGEVSDKESPTVEEDAAETPAPTPAIRPEPPPATDASPES